MLWDLVISQSPRSQYEPASGFALAEVERYGTKE